MSADFTFCPIQLFSRFFPHPLLHLLPDQPLVNPVQLDQLRVPPPLHHPPLLHHQDLVGISHGRQSVGDHQDGPTLHDPLKGFGHHLDLWNAGVNLLNNSHLFILCIQGGSGFVQDENPWIANRCPSYGQPLSLTTRQLGTIRDKTQKMSSRVHFVVKMRSWEKI